MKFTMKMPFEVVPGPRCDGYYTATVVDKDRREVGAFDVRVGLSASSQQAANEAAVRKAQEWARRVRVWAEG